MSRKTQHTRFEDRILRKLANEDKPQIVPPCTYNILDTGYWKDEYIQNTQIGVGAGVHCVGHSIVKATVEDSGGGRGARHNR